MKSLDRRSFLRSITLAAVAGTPTARLGALAGSRRSAQLGGRDPFTLGVASGDPSSDGFVLWTRLAPDPLHGGGMAPSPVRVRWELADDDGFRRIVRHGTFDATDRSAHAVHVELNGLPSDRWFWYRFATADAVSPIGRTRTLPDASAAVARLRFAFASCQHYEHGFFTAYRHLVADEPSVLFHLGDYIYEYPAGDGRARRHVGGELLSLDDYRTRYAQYKTDPDLQAAHALCPWVVTWDDHEVADNYAGAQPQIGEPIDGFLRRRAAAYQAYYEHMPLRSTARPRSTPRGTEMPLYRRITIGRLASFFVLDTRQYRTPQPCGDNTTWPCDDMHDPRATLLGAAQERWLFDGLRTSPTRWNVLPQQVMVANVNRRQRGRDRYTMDHWAGYEAQRQRLLQCFASRREANPVVLTGDVHSHWVNDLRATPDGPAVATELVGTSITTGGDGQDLPRPIEQVLADNPFVRFYNEQRGYVMCDVTPSQLQADFRVLDAVSRPGASCTSRARFVVDAGRPGAQRA